jgi:hypothetical protein
MLRSSAAMGLDTGNWKQVNAMATAADGIAVALWEQRVHPGAHELNWRALRMRWGLTVAWMVRVALAMLVHQD